MAAILVNVFYLFDLEVLNLLIQVLAILRDYFIVLGFLRIRLKCRIHSKTPIIFSHHLFLNFSNFYIGSKSPIYPHEALKINFRHFFRRQLTHPRVILPQSFLTQHGDQLSQRALRLISLDLRSIPAELPQRPNGPLFDLNFRRLTSRPNLLLR